MKQYIPNFITLLNLLCGCIATVYAVSGELVLAAIFVGLGIFFDFFDGFFARLFKVQSEVGVQLDSLADMITSGLVPGIVMFQLFNMSALGEFESSLIYELKYPNKEQNLLPFFGFTITLASAYRLAKFNVYNNKLSDFIGLPTPANALLILSLPLILEFQYSDTVGELILSKWFLIALTLLSCYLLNSKIRLISLKFTNWDFKENSVRYIFMTTAIVLMMAFKFLAIPLVLFAYLLISVFHKNQS